MAFWITAVTRTGDALRAPSFVKNIALAALLLVASGNSPAVEHQDSQALRERLSGVQQAALLHSRSYAWLHELLNTTGNWSGEIWNRRKSGDIYVAGGKRGKLTCPERSPSTARERALGPQS